MPAPPIPPSSLSTAQLIAQLTANGGVALKTILAALPTTPDGLSPGDPWNNNNSLAFIPKS